MTSLILEALITRFSPIGNFAYAVYCGIKVIVFPPPSHLPSRRLKAIDWAAQTGAERRELGFEEGTCGKYRSVVSTLHRRNSHLCMTGDLYLMGIICFCGEKVRVWDASMQMCE